jgi:hypothetical protein
LPALYEVPLKPTPQKFHISLGGIDYVFQTEWNAAASAQYWMLTISDTNENPLVYSIPLLTGCDLLEQYDYLSIGGGGKMLVQSDHSAPDNTPTFSNLGITSHLFWLPP